MKGSGTSGERHLLPAGRLVGPMPWVLAIMTFLTVLATGAGVGLGRAAAALGDDLSGRLTVQILDGSEDMRDARAKAVAAELARVPSVAQVTIVDKRHMRDLLRPWLGQDSLDFDLPLPALLDVQLRSGGGQDADQAVHAIRSVAPKALIESQVQWLAPLSETLSTLRWLAVGLVILMAAAMAAAVILASRSALVTHRATIDIMHLMGATDGQIARLFQRRAGNDALFGSGIGCICGALIVVAIGGQMNRVGAAMLGSADLGWKGWLAIGLLPFAAVALSVVTARWTVVRMLGRML